MKVEHQSSTCFDCAQIELASPDKRCWRHNDHGDHARIVLQRGISPLFKEWACLTCNIWLRDGATLHKEDRVDRDFMALQAEVDVWAKRNFPRGEPWEPLVGLQEEIGELAHAHLKMHQGIRLEEDHKAAARDAIGDILVYLADYCSRNGYDLQDCVWTAWETVKKRDWVKHREEYAQ